MLKILNNENTRNKLLNYISALMIEVNTLVILKYYKDLESRQISTKASEDDFVTIADKESEEFIVRKLVGFLNINHYIGEETSYINKNEYKSKKYQSLSWVIDPIDGTSNFILGIPHVAIVIGKIVNDQITDGIIYNPILNEFYWASLGKGAWCNNKRIRVSKRQDLVECLIGTGIPFGGRIYPNYYKELEKISKLSAGVRRLGAAALDLAYVSSGKMDGFWEKDLNLWDVSAGVLLIKEAGGRVTEPQGNNWTTKSRDILVSNTLIHEKLLENLTLL